MILAAQHVHSEVYFRAIWGQVLVTYWQYRTTLVGTYEQKKVLNETYINQLQVHSHGYRDSEITQLG